MMIEIQLWHLVSLLVSFMGCAAGFWKFTEARREKAEDQRWSDLHRHIDARFASMAEERREEREQYKQLERSFMEFKADMPHRYVMREDHVRMQSVIEAKIDSLALRFENARLRTGGKNE